MHVMDFAAEEEYLLAKPRFSVLQEFFGIGACLQVFCIGSPSEPLRPYESMERRNPA
jgi:hypothetical protein